MGRPTIRNVRWATDAVFTNGPDVGLPTKVEPSDGVRAEGAIPDRVMPANRLNAVLHGHGEFIHYYKDIDWLTWTIYDPVDYSSEVFTNSFQVNALGSRSIPYPESGWPLVGLTNSMILVSRDGINWGTRAFPNVGAFDQNYAYEAPKAIRYSELADLWIALGSSTSTDHILTAPTNANTWTPRTDPGPTADRVASAESASIIVVARSAGGFITSTDGITWTERTHPAVAKHMRGVAYGNGTFVAVGQDVIVTSLDGITWTDRSANTPLVGTQKFQDITFDPTLGKFIGVAIGVGVGNGAVASSADGITWANITPTIPRAFGSVITDGGGAIYALDITTGSVAIARSLDAGANWEGQFVDFIGFPKGIAYGTGRLIAFGRYAGAGADTFAVALGPRVTPA